MIYIDVLLFAVAGAAWRRWLGDGAGERGLVLAIGAGLAVAAVFLGRPVPGTWWLAALAFLAVGGLAVLFWAPGHGSYTDMGTGPAMDNEITAPIMRRLLGPGSGVRYDFVGLVVRYGIPAALLAVLLAFFRGPGAFLLLAVPFGIAVAYWGAWRFQLPWAKARLGWTAEDTKYFQPTIIGEFAAGALFYGALRLV